MYSSENIIWIKNVKRDNGDSWAYDDVQYGSTFLLNWPTKMPKSASTPNVGDIIVLFQKPNTVNGQKNYQVHITHLVSPVSEEVIPDDDSPKHKWCRKVQLIAKADPIDSIPNPGYYNFYKPNRGLTNPLINLTNDINLSESETKDDLWSLFGDYFCCDLVGKINQSEILLSAYGELEGDKVIREHIFQELSRRNPKIVYQAKEQALLKNNGRIKCECCQFDFFAFYGQIGEKFIECHHKKHISSGERITRIEDLALVCPNCHRMLHRKNAEGSYFTTEELGHLINSIEK